MKSLLPTWDLTNKKVILRADLNIPLSSDGTIIDDYRLISLQPTLDYILNHDGSIILITHLGRPKDKEKRLSSEHLIPWFEQRGYRIFFAKNLQQATSLASSLPPKSILLLENIRFFPEEQQRSVPFADQIARLGDYYLNDGFGVMHRPDTSVTLVPEFFAKKDKTFGFLVEKELHALNTLLENPGHPFVCIIGGAKGMDKIKTIQTLLPIANTILLCPAIVFTFMKAQGLMVGKSLVDDKALELCKRLLVSNEKKFILPTDFLVSEHTVDGPYHVVASTQFTPNMIGIALGPQTITHFSNLIKQAKTVFFNGAQGFYDKPDTMKGMKYLFEAMNQSEATTIIAGGDSVAAARQFGFDATHLSSGGGASLAYIGDKKLPGLTALQVG